jgi:hypothetical protein
MEMSYLNQQTNNTNNNNIINPKSCVYGCNTRIYWNTLENAYFEVFTNKKHICPNRSSNNNANNNNNNNKPNYYNKKSSWNNNNNSSKFIKQPMDNSLEVLQGSSFEVKRKYEILTNLIKQYGGAVLGSQSHILQSSGNGNKDLTITIVVYFQVPEGRLNDFKKEMII